MDWTALAFGFCAAVFLLFLWSLSWWHHRTEGAESEIRELRLQLYNLTGRVTDAERLLLKYEAKATERYNATRRRIRDLERSSNAARGGDA